MPNTTTIMFAVLDHLSDWLRPKQQKARQTEAPAMFIFSAGPQLRLDDHALMEIPASQAVQSLPLNVFLEKASSMRQALVSKVPMVMSGTSLSRLLLPQSEVAAVQTRSLSSIMRQAMQIELASGGDASNGEHFSWSLMDHVIFFPYYHPDGFVRGTTEFLDWHLCIQKQYAMILYCQQALKEYIIKLGERNDSITGRLPEPKGWILVDAYGNEQPNMIAATEAEMTKAQEEYADITKRITNFRIEQKMLQKAFLRTMNMCLGPAPEANHGPGIKAHTGLISSIVILRPLNPGQKRRATQPPVRPSASRQLDGHFFVCAQKKQRKTNPAGEVHEMAKDMGTLKLMDGIEDQGSTTSSNGEGSEIPEEVETDTSIQLDETQTAILMANATALESSLSDVEEARNEIRCVAEDMQNHLAFGPMIDAIDDLDATLAGLDFEFDQVKSVQQDLAEALQGPEVKHKLTVEEVAESISERGMDYLDLIDQFEDRVPDTLDGIKLLREMIDEAGFVDEESGMVYRRGPVEFGELFEDFG